MNTIEAKKNNAEWASKIKADDPVYFRNLSEGQKPEMLYIGCSDSRVCVETMLDAKPGEIFVHRNIANLVLNNDLSALSVIEYAVAHLNVKHLVVCGHRACGGVKAAMTNADLGILNPWISHIKNVYQKHFDELDKIHSENKKYERLIELNVIEQCLNALKLPVVQKAFNKGNLEVHGWVFDLPSGLVIDLDFDSKKMVQDIKNVHEIA